ncbi:MAG: alpha/beta hydrolase [Limnobacter sp.]|nr:alpha/beta hydrolase [Limnobacter sp.]
MHQVRLNTVQWLSPEGLKNLAYREWGAPNNPHVLLCVHGLTRSSQDFDTVAQKMAHCTKVVSVDMPGRGRSDWFANGANYAVPNYVAACVALVARLNAEKLDWLGTSMGGLIGMGYASLPNNPIRKLILNDVGPSLNLEALQRIGTYVGADVQFDTRQQAHQYIRSISAPFGPHTEEQWAHLCDTVLVQKNGKFIPHYDPAISTGFKDMNAQVVQAMEGALWAAYDSITTPTLLVRGENSDLLSAATAQQMTQRGPKAKLIEVKGVGHAPTFMQDDQIQLVSDFLD